MKIIITNKLFVSMLFFMGCHIFCGELKANLFDKLKEVADTVAKPENEVVEEEANLKRGGDVAESVGFGNYTIGEPFVARLEILDGKVVPFAISKVKGSVTPKDSIYVLGVNILKPTNTNFFECKSPMLEKIESKMSSYIWGDFRTLGIGSYYVDRYDIGNDEDLRAKQRLKMVLGRYLRWVSSNKEDYIVGEYLDAKGVRFTYSVHVNLNNQYRPVYDGDNPRENLRRDSQLRFNRNGSVSFKYNPGTAKFRLWTIENYGEMGVFADRVVALAQESPQAVSTISSGWVDLVKSMEVDPPSSYPGNKKPLDDFKLDAGNPKYSSYSLAYLFKEDASKGVFLDVFYPRDKSGEIQLKLKWQDGYAKLSAGSSFLDRGKDFSGWKSVVEKFKMWSAVAKENNVGVFQKEMPVLIGVEREGYRMEFFADTNRGEYHLKHSGARGFSGSMPADAIPCLELFLDNMDYYIKQGYEKYSITVDTEENAEKKKKATNDLFK